MTIKDVYLQGREHLQALKVAEPAIEAEMLLRFVLGWDRARLYTHWDGPMPEPDAARYRALLDERSRGRPVHYIVGEREFMGLAFALDERVLIPRPETEPLVAHVAQWARKERAGLIADIGTGSGAVAVSLAHQLPGITVHATDISAAALEVARGNAERHGVASRIRFYAGDLLAALPDALRGRLDAIASNPPYVPEDQAFLLSREITEFEPAQAIFVPGDGSMMHRRLVAGAPEWLRPGGLLAMEVGAGQAEPIGDVVRADGRYTEVTLLPDGIGIERVVAARRREAPEGDSSGGRK